MIMFADDTNIFFTGRNYETIYECANKQLCNIDHWLIANKLSLNVEKTNHVVFRTTNSKPPSNNLTLLIRNKRINRVTSSKFLGVILHENLSWKPHMDTVLKRLRISLGVVRKISSYLNPILGGVFVLPILGGGGQICPPLSNSLLERARDLIFCTLIAPHQNF